MNFKVGYEIGTGKEVDAELHHLAIFGLTQRSGKTTALEGFISRIDTGMKVLAFRTKRGDISFENASPVPYFFRERTDWQFVEGLISAHLHEKAKFYRGDIMRAVRGAASLREVWQNVRNQLGRTRSGSFPEKIYTELDQYLSEIVPAVEGIKFSGDVILTDKTSVMDLEPLGPAMQQLVISATVDRIMESRTETIVVLPEARDFIPGDRRTPAKLALESLVRKGAALRNFLWVDSQSLTGLDLGVMRSIGVWLFGRQDLDIEVTRSAKSIPGSGITGSDVKALTVGQFYLVQGEKVSKVYVQPVWVSDEEARAISLGEGLIMRRQAPEAETGHRAGRFEEEKMESSMMKEISEMKQKILDQERLIMDLRSRSADGPAGKLETAPQETTRSIEFTTKRYELVVREEGVDLKEFTTADYYGKIMFVLSASPDHSGTREQIMARAADHGWHLVPVQTSAKLGVLVRDGYVIRIEGKGSPVFRIPENATVREAIK